MGRRRRRRRGRGRLAAHRGPPARARRLSTRRERNPMTTSSALLPEPEGTAMAGSRQPRRPEARTLMAQSPRIEDLRAQARHHRERLDLYRAKMYGLRPTTMTRLRELERIEQAAEARLREAEQDPASHPQD